MTKKIMIFLTAVVMLSCLSACGSVDQTPASGQDSAFVQDADKLQIVTTIFPEYDWIRELAGDQAEHVELTMLLDSGVDLHSYQPTAADILKISTCDLFVYTGGESDEWVEDALKEKTNPDMVVLNLLDILGDAAKEEELIEGMNEEEEQEGGDNGGEEIEYDEHIWLSLKNAQILCGSIADALKEIDPAHADAYAANEAGYRERLSVLDEQYDETVQNAGCKTLLFGDRFPFRYLVDDYGLTYYAAFAGCSAETEASFETISFLSKKVDELGLAYIMTIQGSDRKIAETILQNTRNKTQQILTLDSMQSTTAKDVQGGVTYLGIMEQNLAILKEALQ